MAEVWNLWETKPPPVCTTKTVLHLKEINNLKECLFDVLKTLKNLKHLHKEAAILSRFLYKNKRTFRHEKGTQNLVKINQCLRRYQKLNLFETVNTFKQSLPHKFSSATSHAYLPTRQMLKWVLLRIQAFSQIFNRVIKISKDVGAYIWGKFFLGWSLNNAFLIFSMTARILAISKYLLAKSIEWYNSLYKYMPYLEATTEYLPDYKLPVDLKKWLGDVDIMPPKTKSSIDEVFEVIDLTRKDEEEDDEIEIVKEKFFISLLNAKSHFVDSDIEELPVLEAENTKKKRPRPLQNEDVGCPLSDDESLSKTTKFKKKKKQCLKS